MSGKRLPQAELPPAPAETPTTTSAARLAWFDLTRGSWTAMAALRRRLGTARLLRVGLSLLWRGLLRDPFRGLPRPSGRRERLSRKQMKPVLLLDEIFRGPLKMTPAESLDVLEEVVGRSGARFLDYNIDRTLLDRDRWRATPEPERRARVDGLLARFFNMQAESAAPEEGAEFGFDVRACHFARLGAQLDRRDLVGVFCAADRWYFDDPAVPVELRREETLAGGAPRCGFRFAFKPEE